MYLKILHDTVGDDDDRGKPCRIIANIHSVEFLRNEDDGNTLTAIHGPHSGVTSFLLTGNIYLMSDEGNVLQVFKPGPAQLFECASMDLGYFGKVADFFPLTCVSTNSKGPTVTQVYSGADLDAYLKSHVPLGEEIKVFTGRIEPTHILHVVNGTVMESETRYHPIGARWDASKQTFI